MRGRLGASGIINAMTEPNDVLAPYDALLLVSFGGPEAPEEVVPFLAEVTKGSGIPRERLAVVGEHYSLFGGRSPINDQCRALLSALTTELAARGVTLPWYWGNRNWHPFIAPTVDQIVADGHRRVLALTTSAYPSAAGCRSYRDAVRQAVGDRPLRVDWVGNFGLDDFFVDVNATLVRGAMATLPGAHLVFVTHSIPSQMAAASGPAGDAYVTWHRQVASSIATRLEASGTSVGDHDLVFCSRSGRPGQPWLEPDVNDHLESLRERGVRAVVLAPIGFISDHMEVIYDLDVQARASCQRLGIEMVRVPTAGTAPGMVTGLADRMQAVAAMARTKWPSNCQGGQCIGCTGDDCCVTTPPAPRPV